MAPGCTEKGPLRPTGGAEKAKVSPQVGGEGQDAAAFTKEEKRKEKGERSNRLKFREKGHRKKQTNRREERKTKGQPPRKKRTKPTSKPSKERIRGERKPSASKKGKKKRRTSRLADICQKRPDEGEGGKKEIGLACLKGEKKALPTSGPTQKNRSTHSEERKRVLNSRGEKGDAPVLITQFERFQTSLDSPKRRKKKGS